MQQINDREILMLEFQAEKIDFATDDGTAIEVFVVVGDRPPGPGKAEPINLGLSSEMPRFFPAESIQAFDGIIILKSSSDNDLVLDTRNGKSALIHIFDSLGQHLTSISSEDIAPHWLKNLAHAQLEIRL